jgi:hypothetical protein
MEGITRKEARFFDIVPDTQNNASLYQFKEMECMRGYGNAVRFFLEICSEIKTDEWSRKRRLFDRKSGK